MTVTTVIIGIVLCIALSAFFSASEMAYSSCNPIRLEGAMEDGDRRAKAAFRITEKFDDALSTILIGNNLVNIAASSLSSVLIMMLFGDDRYTWAATAVLTVLVIIFGETVPKITAKKNANRYAVSFAYFIRTLTFILKPLVWLTVKLIWLITLGMKDDSETDSDEAVEELQSIIETAEDEEVLDEERSELVQAAIDFPEIAASEVMTARVDVHAIDIDDDWNDIISAIEDAPYSRIPVYEDSIDNIIGVLYLNRFLKALTEEERPDIRGMLMPPCYVYKTMKMPAVLSQLRKARQHLAIVSDEYGGMLGVLSMEDVLEQIVGDIWDEKDTVEEEVHERSSGEWELDGDMTIADFIELAGIDEQSFSAESETVGGWTVESFGMFPRVGDKFNYEDLTVTVLAMDGHRVGKLLVKKDIPAGEKEQKS